MNRIELVKSANEWGIPDRDSLYTDDFQFTDALDSPPMDKRTLLAMAELMQSALPDITTVIEDIREEGEEVVVTSHWAGTFTKDFDLSAMGAGVIPASAVRIRYAMPWGSEADAEERYPVIPTMLDALYESPPAEVPLRGGQANYRNLQAPTMPDPVSVA